MDVKVIIVLVSSSAVLYIFQNKIMIELNYMLSNCAAESYPHLLWKFNLLEFLLPVHVSGFELLTCSLVMICLKSYKLKNMLE